MSWFKSVRKRPSPYICSYIVFHHLFADHTKVVNDGDLFCKFCKSIFSNYLLKYNYEVSEIFSTETNWASFWENWSSMVATIIHNISPD